MMARAVRHIFYRSYMLCHYVKNFIYVEYDNREVYLLIDRYLHTKEIDIFPFIFPGSTIT